MRARKRESGQAMVEFALILPVFILILLGIVEFGAYLTQSLSVTSAAREGARYGITCSSDSGFASKVEQRVENSAPNLDDSRLSVTATKTSSSGENMVTVSLDYTAETLTPLGMLLWGSEYHVTSSCTMRVG